MTIEIAQAIGIYIVSPICGVVALWVFMHYLTK